MITKRPKVVILFVGFMLLGAIGLSALAIGAGNGNGDDAVEIDLDFAGTLIQGVQYVPSSTGVQIDGTLGQFEFKGEPGRGNATLFAGQTGDPVLSDCCDSGLCLLIPITENPLVLTFKDLSLLFANGTGEICVDLLTGRSTFTIDIMFTGGRGRFEGATGEAVIVGEVEPVSSNGAFNGETGQIVGTILLPDDDD